MCAICDYVAVVFFAASISADDLNDFTALYREHCEVCSCVVVDCGHG